VRPYGPGKAYWFIQWTLQGMPAVDAEGEKLLLRLAKPGLGDRRFRIMEGRSGPEWPGCSECERTASPLAVR
jgi:hypothetical protein